MSSPNYYVDSYDDAGITLRMSPWRFVKVRIPRASIASIQDTLGILRVETTGHRQYRVVSGYRSAQRELTAAAFAA